MALAAASMPASGWESTFTNLAPGAHLPRPAGSLASRALGTDDANLRNTARCPTCGIVVKVRTLPLAGTAPAAYELTVRFRDGSRRLSHHADDAAWRVGDSIMLMGGTRLAERH